MKKVQIPMDLFLALVKYHCFDLYEYETDIKRELEKKLNLMVMRGHYTAYKTAPTEQEREEARKKYLDEKGVPTNFRW